MVVVLESGIVALSRPGMNPANNTGKSYLTVTDTGSDATVPMSRVSVAVVIPADIRTLSARSDAA